MDLIKIFDFKFKIPAPFRKFSPKTKIGISGQLWCPMKTNSIGNPKCNHKSVGCGRLKSPASNMFQRIFPFAFLFYFSETNAFLGEFWNPSSLQQLHRQRQRPRHRQRSPISSRGPRRTHLFGPHFILGSHVGANGSLAGGSIPFGRVSIGFWAKSAFPNIGIGRTASPWVWSSALFFCFIYLESRRLMKFRFLLLLVRWRCIRLEFEWRKCQESKTIN